MREALAASLPAIETAAPAAAAKRAPGEGLAPYLLVAPLALVFLLFFIVPMILVMAVSFFDYEAYDMLIPAFSLPELCRRVLRAGDLGHLPQHDQVLPAGLGDHPRARASRSPTTWRSMSAR